MADCSRGADTTRSLAPKRDGLIIAGLGIVGIVAHQIFAAFREREIKLPAQGQHQVDARFRCNLLTKHLKRSSRMVKPHLPVCFNGERTGSAGTVSRLPVTNQPGVHLLSTSI